MDGRTVITIGREFGSGGHEIGMKLAERLGIKCYDKELLELAAKESGLCKELFASQDEKPTNSFLYSLVMDTYSLGYSNSYVDMPINHKVFLAQFDAIKKLAEKESCVIVGRCADYALEDDPFAVSVFVKASIDERVKRIFFRRRICATKHSIYCSTLQRYAFQHPLYRRTITQMPFATWFQIHRISFLYHQGRRTSSLPSGIRAGCACARL